MGAAILAGKWTVLGVFAIKAVLVMVLIALAAAATPHIAKIIDKHRKPMVKEDRKDNVRGIFDASRDEDFDPNYKIYNTDIYGFNRSEKQTSRKSERNDNKNGEE